MGSRASTITSCSPSFSLMRVISDQTSKIRIDIAKQVGILPDCPKYTPFLDNTLTFLLVMLGFLGFFWVFLEKGVESTFLNIPDNLRPTYFFHFFIGISSVSDTEHF